MNDKWTDGDVLASPHWIEEYSRTNQKCWSFAACSFVVLGLLFVGNSQFEIFVALFVLALTGVNMIHKSKKASLKRQAIITLAGYSVSVLLVIYANTKHYI